MASLAALRPGRDVREAAPAPARHPVVTHLAVLIGYLAASIAVTWPRAAYLTRHEVPGTRDAALFVWDFWWMARSVTHLSNPWVTRYLAAPFGSQLGFHTLMPLPGALMTPVTLIWGPSFSYNLLSAAAPALLCYAMYRAARLWLSTQTAAIAAGAFFGLSTIVTWNAWYEVNLALGAVFLPMTLEAVVRLRRRPTAGQAAVLGAVLGAALLTDQESAILAGALAVVALIPWLARRPRYGGARILVKLRAAAVAAVVCGAVASPQIIAMVQQTLAGNAGTSQATLTANYIQYAATLQQIFAPTARVNFFGLHGLAEYYYRSGPIGVQMTAYGVVLTALALAGLALHWRHRSTKLLGGFWLVCTATALGTGIVIGTHRYVPFAQRWHGLRVSLIMPYTWFIRLPLLSSFRESNRIVELGLVAVALLAAAAVDWLCRHAAAFLSLVFVLAIFETGCGGAGLTAAAAVTMPTALPALDGPIAADHSSSIVVDIPFGVRSGAPLPDQGPPFDPESMLQATADGHPRAVAYVSRLPESTLVTSDRQPFYADLLAAQHSPRILESELFPGFHRPGGPWYRTRRARLAVARTDQARLIVVEHNVRRLGIGWAIVWQSTPGVLRYLEGVGFRYAYSADGASVYRLPPHETTPVTLAAP